MTRGTVTPGWAGSIIGPVPRDDSCSDSRSARLSFCRAIRSTRPLPDPATLFAQRAQRLRALGENHALGTTCA